MTHEQETRSEDKGEIAKGGEAGASIGAEAAPDAGGRARAEGHEKDGAESLAKDGTEDRHAPRAQGSSPEGAGPQHRTQARGP
jgi:hypothetical protein